jgi:hypothetical protein
MSARDCVKNAVKNTEEELLRKNHEGLELKADSFTKVLATMTRKKHLGSLCC